MTHDDPAPGMKHLRVTCTSHQLSTAASDAQHPAPFSRFGVLEVPSSTSPRPSSRKHRWAQHLADLVTKPGEKCRLMTFPLVILALAVGSCAPSPEEAATSIAPNEAEYPAMNEAPPVEMPHALLPDGFEVTLELAITPEELSQGLMFRPRLPEDRGMLLIFAEERLPSIWMMNTLVALDLVYLDSSGTVVDIITDAQPCPGEPCPRFSPKQPAKAVLEIPAGTATRHGVTEGVQLNFARVPDFPSGG